MLWFCDQEKEFAMLTVQATAIRGVDLLRVSAQGARILGHFARRADAVQRWNEMEDELRRLNAHAPGSNPKRSRT